LDGVWNKQSCNGKKTGRLSQAIYRTMEKIGHEVVCKVHLVSVLILLLLAALSGCLPNQKAGLSDQQVASVTENILKALDQNNYPAFTHDLSPQ